MTFTDELINDLISCKKRITDSPRSVGSSRGSEKIKFSVESLYGREKFTCFISRNFTFQENFSVGLVYQPKDEKWKIVLLRVNGSHGPNENAPHHDGPHVHISTAERINAGLKPEGQIEVSVPFLTYEEAIQYFLERINVDPSDIHKHFPPPNNQLNFNFEEEENV